MKCGSWRFCIVHTIISPCTRTETHLAACIKLPLLAIWTHKCMHMVRNSTPFQIKNFPCKFQQLSYDEPCQLYALQVGSWPQKTQDTLLVDGVDTVFVDFKCNMLLQFLKCQFHEKACFLHLKLNKQIRWYVFRLQTDHQFSVSAISLTFSVE